MNKVGCELDSKAQKSQRMYRVIRLLFENWVRVESISKRTKCMTRNLLDDWRDGWPRSMNYNYPMHKQPVIRKPAKA